jgi:hypothetical protein
MLLVVSATEAGSAIFTSAHRKSAIPFLQPVAKKKRASGIAAKRPTTFCANIQKSVDFPTTYVLYGFYLHTVEIQYYIENVIKNFLKNDPE